MIKYAVVENGIVTESYDSLPIVWKNVSGFHHIGDDVEALKSYGWYIVNTVMPTYDPNTQTINEMAPQFTYNAKSDIVRVTYPVNEIDREPVAELQRRFLVLIRDNRDLKLKESDWTMMPDVTDTKPAEWVNAWKDYRQALRNLPDTITLKPDEIPDFSKFTGWPVEPASN